MITLIVEDEKIAAERLRYLVEQVLPGVVVETIIDSVEACVSWLSNHTHPDFILLDIDLSDGSAFDIFKKVKVNVPIIFTTAYDQYAMDAFKVLSIDYLLKPVSAEALSAAIQKLALLRSLTVPLTTEYDSSHLLNGNTQNFKTRFIGKVGQKSFFIDAGDISYFTADNKIVQLYSIDGNHYIIDYTLEELEALLDPKDFFRVNRSIIIKAKAIEQIKPHINSRLKIIYKSGRQMAEAIVSRERVSDFKAWAHR